MKGSFSFTDPMLEAWAIFQKAHSSLIRCEEMVFAKTGITPQQYAVLLAIKYISDPVTQTDIAHWLDRKTNSITLIVDRMEKAGLVRRSRDQKDRRTIQLLITEKGMKDLVKATGPKLDLIREIFSALTEEELRVFSKLLERVREKAFYLLMSPSSRTIDQKKLLAIGVQEPKASYAQRKRQRNIPKTNSKIPRKHETRPKRAGDSQMPDKRIK